MNKYYEGGMWRKAVDVQTSRGCPYKCRFCVHSVLGDHKVRMLSADRVVDECERLIKTGVDFITFVDDNFFLNRKRARYICQEIIKRGLKFKWFAEVRADYFRQGFIDEDFLALAEESGLTNLTIGAESGVPDVLKLMGKDITVENIIHSARVLAKTKIATAFSFIIGLPDETRREINETIKFVEQLERIYPDGTYNISTLRAYPGSKLTASLIDKGIIKKPSNLRDFVDYKFNKVYTESPSKPVWCEDPDYVYSVARYSSIAYSPYNGVGVRENIQNASLLLIPEKILQEIARWRLRHHLFIFPLDLYLSKLLRYLYTAKFLRKIVKCKSIAK